MNFKLIFIIIGMAFIATSCTVSSGLVRTNFDNWSQKQFDQSGLKCDLPKQDLFDAGYYVKEYSNEKILKSTGFKMIFIKLHPIYHSIALAEPEYLIYITINRLDKTTFEKYKSGKFQIGGTGVFQEQTDIFHSKLQQYTSRLIGIHGYDKDDMLIYRKDYEAPNGDFIICGASINLSSGVASFPSAEDLNAVKRILESVVPIE